jgi:hypothetical protein
MIGTAKTVAVIAATCGLLLGVRAMLAPDWHEPAEVALDPGETAAVRQLMAPALLDRRAVTAQVAPARYLLVGETHFKQETVAWFTGLLDDLGSEPLVLLLELPAATQPAIDRYLASGDEAAFQGIWGEFEALPLQGILRWAEANQHRVRAVIAMDEDGSTIFINRALLDDTRNQTMADAIMQAAKAHPEARVVAYAGAMHVMLAGRYRFDVDNRRPAGMRLLEAGIPREEIASISLAGDELPVADAFEAPAALDLRSPAGLLPYEFFYSYPIYGAARASELHTHLVYLGPLTRQETWTPGQTQSAAPASPSENSSE